MITQMDEFDAYESWKDYCAELEEKGDEPLNFRDWCAEEQIEPV